MSWGTPHHMVRRLTGELVVRCRLAEGRDVAWDGEAGLRCTETYRRKNSNDHRMTHHITMSCKLCGFTGLLPEVQAHETNCKTRERIEQLELTVKKLLLRIEALER